MTRKLRSIIFLGFLLFVSSATFATVLLNYSPALIRYVVSGGAGTKDGFSWENASEDLQLMIDQSTTGGSIFVAGGTYEPASGQSFSMKECVKIYGGFAGTETDLFERNLASNHTSILKRNGNSVIANNNNGLTTAAILDGFTITGGHAKDGAAGNDGKNGGGMFNDHASPTISNCIFTANTAGNGGSGTMFFPGMPSIGMVGMPGYIPGTPPIPATRMGTGGSGGGMYNTLSAPVIINCIFAGNKPGVAGTGGMGMGVSGYGGGMYNSSSTPIITNCTFSKNSTYLYGGGMYNSSSSPLIRNSIIYGNDSGIYNDSSSPTISYSLVQNLTDTGNGNIASTDPKFVDAANGNYHLQYNSPVINKGNNTYFDAGATPDLHLIVTDLAGNPRIYGASIEIGAYESQTISLAPDANHILYVTPTGNGDLTGNSWANATSDLQRSINTSDVQQVWVAGGTYKPQYRADDMSDADPNDRDNAFVLKNNVKIYGGFKGDEILLTERDLSLTTNSSTLSADFNGDDDGFTNNGENAYHVVVSSNNDNSAIIDGFTLSGGNAVSSINLPISGNQVYQCSGGGIYLSVSSPILRNLIITRNAVGESGGGIFGYESSPILSAVTIQGNTARNGGGMANQSNSSPVLSNVTITGNEATELGGGLYNVTSSNPILTSLSISGNTASDGGGIYNQYSSSPQIRNSIIYGNNSGISDDGTSATISYSLVQGLTDAATGNIADTDPKFVDASNGNYHLQDNSPVINKGNNAYFDADATPDLHLVVTDLDGNPRIHGASIDMGAYESQTTLPVSLLNFTVNAQGNQALLQWRTASEQNNNRFLVYRSAEDGNFVELGKREGAGTAANYSFYDRLPLNGNNYYKLVQVDHNGTQTELGIKSLSFSLQAPSLMLFPNPTENSLIVKVFAGRYQQLELTDLNGRTLQNLSIGQGEDSIPVNLGNYAPGTYLIRLKGNTHNDVLKALKK